MKPMLMFVFDGVFDLVCLTYVALFYTNYCLLKREDSLLECRQYCYIQNSWALNQTEVWHQSQLCFSESYRQMHQTTHPELQSSG